MAPGQSRVEESGERASLSDHLPGHGGTHLVDDALHSVGGQPRQGCVGSHATGVGPLVTVSDPFVVLGRQQRNHCRPVDEAEEGDLGPVEEAFEQYGVACCVDGAYVCPRLVPVGGDDHPLTPGQAVVLDHPGGAEPVEGGFDVGVSGSGAHGFGPCRTDTGGRHDALGEGFGALDAGGCTRGTENGEPCLTQGVRHSRDEGDLRADDHQVRGQGAGQVDHGRGVLPPCLRVQGGDCGHSGVAGGHVHLRHLGVLRERVGEGVFTGSVADDECAHGQRS